MKKRILSLFLVVVLMISICVGCSKKESKPTANKNSSQTTTSSVNSNTSSSSQSSTTTSSNGKTSTKVNTLTSLGESNMSLTFCAMSDVHMGANKTEAKFTDAMKNLSNTKVKPDAYLFVGDLTDSTGSSLKSTQVDKFKGIYEKYASPSQMIYTLGPTHDVPESGSPENARDVYESTFGSAYYSEDLEPQDIREKGVRWKKIKGYSFFSLDWDGSSGSAGAPTSSALNWFKNQLEAESKADPNKPIFVLVHVSGRPAIENILKNFPQVVCFTAHIHNSFAREDSISQDKGFTSVHCGGQNYYRVDGYNRFNENPFLNLGNIYNFGQALYVQVDKNNNVTITRVDTFNTTTLKTTWVVGPNKRNVYTNARKTTAQKCMFEKSDVLMLKVIDNKHLTVSFDACKSGEAGPPLYYKIQLLAPNSSGVYEVINHVEISSKQVFYPNDEGIPSQLYSYTFTNLSCLKNYAVVVTAIDCWNTSGNALVYTNGKYDSSIPATGNPVLPQPAK